MNKQPTQSKGMSQSASHPAGHTSVSDAAPIVTENILAVELDVKPKTGECSWTWQVGPESSLKRTIKIAVMGSLNGNVELLRTALQPADVLIINGSLTAHKGEVELQRTIEFLHAITAAGEGRLFRKIMVTTGKNDTMFQGLTAEAIQAKLDPRGAGRTVSYVGERTMDLYGLGLCFHPWNAEVKLDEVGKCNLFFTDVIPKTVRDVRIVQGCEYSCGSTQFLNTVSHWLCLGGGPRSAIFCDGPEECYGAQRLYVNKDVAPGTPQPKFDPRAVQDIFNVGVMSTVTCRPPILVTVQPHSPAAAAAASSKPA